MVFQWDESKRELNLQKHGIDFADGEAVFGGPIATMPDNRFDYGEQRFVTFGLLDGYVVAIVHTEDADTIRIISIRKATKREQVQFFNSVQN